MGSKGEHLLYSLVLALDDLWYIFYMAQNLVLWMDGWTKACLHDLDWLLTKWNVPDKMKHSGA